MSDFDLSLIREFRTRPAFYDRNSPLFKDKSFAAHEWQEISKILGYDVALLKDRMLQLRNRYNLEKRRLEQLQEENPGKHVTSLWPLYDHLGFLSEHIRSRRSFKRMMPRQSSTDMNLSSTFTATGGGGGGGGIGIGIGGGSNGNGDIINGSGSSYITQPLPNGLVSVKVENSEAEAGSSENQSLSNEGQENDGGGGGSTGGGLIADGGIHHHHRSHRQSSINADALADTIQVSCDVPSMTPHISMRTITVRNLDSMRQHASMADSRGGGLAAHHHLHHHHHQQQQQQQQHHHHHHRRGGAGQPGGGGGGGSSETSTRKSSATVVVPHRRELKYEAFGQFIASSLMEIPKTEALLLVEKFTSEVVKVLVETNEPEKMSK